MTAHRLRGAIIGCGYFAQFQLAAWARMPDVELVAACDLDQDRARAAAPHPYCSAAEMFDREQLDFVDIATRPSSHLELARLALSHDVAVICQKPMAATWEEALEMVRLARAAARPLVIHENWRWQPWYRAAHRIIQSGAIGQPVAYCFRTRQRDGLGDAPYPNQPYFRQMPRLLIYETMVHYIDTAGFLFGPITSVYARARRHNPAIQGEDCAMLLLTHGDGINGVLDGHRFTSPEPPGPAMGECWIDGDEAALRINARGEIFRGAESVFTPPPEQGYKGDSVFATQRHFIDCLRADRPAESSAQAYLQTFAAVEAAYRSLLEGRGVTMDEWSAGISG